MIKTAALAAVRAAFEKPLFVPITRTKQPDSESGVPVVASSTCTATSRHPASPPKHQS